MPVAFLLTKSVYVDSNGVSWIVLDGQYDPPDPIGVFDEVFVHVAIGSGKILFGGEFAYDGNAAGVGSARYGTFRVLLPPPTATETWRVYVVSGSASYDKTLVPFGTTGASPSVTVSVAAVTSLLPVAPALPTSVVGSQVSSRQNAYSGLLEDGIRTVITWPTGSTANGVQIYLSRDNGSTWEFVSNNVAVLPGPQTIDDWVDAPATTTTTARVKAIPFNEVWVDPDQLNTSPAVSATFTLSAGALVIVGGITNAALVGAITYVKGSDGTWTWGFTVSGTNPTDVNFFTTNFYVQKVDSSGNPVTTDYEGRLREFTDKDGLGKAWTHTIDNNWTIPPTSSGYKYRIYLYCVNTLYAGAPTIADTFSNPLTTSDPTASLQTSAWGGAHPSYLELAPVEPVGSTGAEYAPVVTGVSASVTYGNDETGAQTAVILGAFTPSTDALYGGCNILAHDNATGREFDLADVPKGAVSNVWQSQPIAVPSAAVNYDIRFFSYDTSGRVNGYLSLVTPHVAVTVQRQSGSSSIEYANLVTGFAAAVRYLTAEDGGQKYVFYGSATAPTDVRFMGANVYACVVGTFSANGSTTVTRLTGRQFGSELVGRTLTIAGGNRTVASVTNGDTMVLTASLSIATYTYTNVEGGQIVGYMDLTQMRFVSDETTVTADAESFALYACSFDAAGRVNTIVDPGPTPKVSLTVSRSTGTAGIENVALVPSFTAAMRPGYSEFGGQSYSLYGSATAPSDQRWAGADIWAAVTGGLTANGTTTVTRTSGREFGQDLVGKTINIAGLIRVVSSVTNANTMILTTSMTAGGWTYVLLNDAWKISYVDRTTANFQTDYWPMPAVSEILTLFAVSFDTSGRSNTIVNGTTPSVAVTIARVAGTLGREYAEIISSPALDGGVVVTTLTKIGELMWLAAGTIVEPTSDPRYGGCKVVRKNTFDPDKSIEIADIPKGVARFRSDFQPELGAGTILVFLSYDTSGRINTFQSGTTPELTVTVPAQGSTLNLAMVLPGSLVTSAFASTITPVALFSSDPALPNSSYPANSFGVNTLTGAFRQVNAFGTGWGPAIDGSTDIVSRSIIAGSIAVGAIGATEIATGDLLVGGLGKQNSRIRVDDLSGNMIMFAGDVPAFTVVNGVSLASRYQGLFARDVRIGTNINTPNILANSTGVTITDCPLTLTLSNLITRLNNSFMFDRFYGFSVTDGFGQSPVCIGPGIIQFLNTTSSGTRIVLTAPNGSNAEGRWYDQNSILRVRLQATLSGGAITVSNDTQSVILNPNNLLFNGIQVIQGRLAGVSTVSGTATGSDAAIVNAHTTAINTIISRLQTHGLIS